MTNNTPFLLKQHDKANEEYRALQPEEVSKVSGGLGWCSTFDVTPNMDGGNYQGPDGD